MSHPCVAAGTIPGRKGDWMQTFTGRPYWPVDPRAEDVKIEDIAHSLAMQCRYGGHSAEFYSVAEHSVLISRMAPPEYALVGLLHDATEAYVTDVPRPLKPSLSNYGELELRNWIAIAEAFSIDPLIPRCIHEADLDLCRSEMRQLMPSPPKPIEWPRPDPYIQLIKLTPEGAKGLFLKRFDELWSERMAARYPAAQFPTIYRRAA